MRFLESQLEETIKLKAKVKHLESQPKEKDIESQLEVRHLESHKKEKSINLKAEVSYLESQREVSFILVVDAEDPS